MQRQFDLIRSQMNSLISAVGAANEASKKNIAKELIQIGMYQPLESTQKQ